MALRNRKNVHASKYHLLVTRKTEITTKIMEFDDKRAIRRFPVSKESKSMKLESTGISDCN